MTVEQFIKLAKDCKSKVELASLAKANGISLSREELDKIFNKINDGAELNDDALESAAGGITFGISDNQLQEFINHK